MDWSIKLSYWLRKNNFDKSVYIDLELLKEIIKTTSLPKPNEQAENLLKFLGSKAKKPDAFVSVSLFNLIPIIGAYDEQNVLYICEYLKNQKLINHLGFARGVQFPDSEYSYPNLEAQLTFSGWSKFDELNKKTKSGKIVFMAMKYNNELLEKIYSQNIKIALKEVGFEIQLLRDVLQAGSIDDQLRVQIRSAKFLLVDLTDDNNGAYWEAGFAEGLDKPVIYLCEKTKFDEFKTHFDTNHLTTVLWHPDTIDEDMKNLKAVIRNTFPLETILED